MRVFLLLICLSASFLAGAQTLDGFTPLKQFDEQEKDIVDSPKDVLISINAPAAFNKKGRTYLVIFALPNGNSIEWTKGKKMKEGDDWHFDIQHIAAQTRFIRRLDRQNNYVVVYLANKQKSWPTWRRTYPDASVLIKNIVDTMTAMLHSFHPHVILNGHSGGGSFIFGYLNGVEQIPSTVDRIAFLDSDYGYEDSLHRRKLVSWLKEDKKNCLFVLAYNDSVVIYNGKPLVSPTGGTWYRSRLMQHNLAESFSFKTTEDTAFIRHFALKERISIVLKQNPNGLIYHTVQVEKNGFIYSILAATRYDRRKYFTYFGERAYEEYIE